jgi:beta-lactamase regulating signal transducer with metallopeptidase domain
MGEAFEVILLVNATMILSAFILWVAEKSLVTLRLRTQYRLRLGLATAALCSSIVPILIFPSMPFFTNILPINGTDILVSQFLKGNINLTATQFSDLLAAKNSAIDGISNSNTLTAKFIISAFVMFALFKLSSVWRSLILIRKQIAYGSVIYSTKKVDIILSSTTTVPYSTRGITKYYIVLPYSSLATSRTLRVSICHEANHIRHGDVDWEMLISIISPLFVLNPAFWFIANKIREVREYNCDATIIEKGQFDAREYSSMLLEVAERHMRSKLPTSRLAHVPFYGYAGYSQSRSRKSLRTRIVALCENPTNVTFTVSRFKIFLFALLLFLSVGAGSLVFIKPTEWSQDRLMLSTVANLERLDKINNQFQMTFE